MEHNFYDLRLKFKFTNSLLGPIKIKAWYYILFFKHPQYNEVTFLGLPDPDPFFCTDPSFDNQK